jgi:hypothetical protein
MNGRLLFDEWDVKKKIVTGNMVHATITSNSHVRICTGFGAEGNRCDESW